MSDKTQELYQAAKALLPFLEASTDKSKDCLDRFRLSKVERLRQEADEMEAKDAAIQRFRAAVAAFEGQA